MWYAIKAWNQETLYGYTDDPAVAEAAVNRLNAGREINLYAAEPLDLVAFGRDQWKQRAGIDDIEPSEQELSSMADKTLSEWSGLAFDNESTVEDLTGELT